MATSFTFPGLHCPRMNCFVSLDQTEGQCRERHACGDKGTCPLQNQLGLSSLERTLARLVAEAWPDRHS